MSVRSRISTAIRRTIMLVPVLNLQKTSISLGKLCVGDWWEWKGCYKGPLHLLPGLIPERPGVGKGLAR